MRHLLVQITLPSSVHLGFHVFRERVFLPTGPNDGAGRMAFWSSHLTGRRLRPPSPRGDLKITKPDRTWNREVFGVTLIYIWRMVT